MTAKDIRNLLWFALLVLKFLSPSNMYYIYNVKSHKLKEKKEKYKIFYIVLQHLYPMNYHSSYIFPYADKIYLWLLNFQCFFQKMGGIWQTNLSGLQ